MDPALTGTWEMVESLSAPQNIGQITYVRDENFVYRIEQKPMSPGEKLEPLYPVKTLRIGSYDFLVSGPQRGGLVRYTMEDNSVVTYTLNLDAFMAFVKDNYPKETNFKRNSVGNSSFLKITELTENAFKILSEIPDTEEYWSADGKYKRM